MTWLRPVDRTSGTLTGPVCPCDTHRPRPDERRRDPAWVLGEQTAAHQRTRIYALHHQFTVEEVCPLERYDSDSVAGPASEPSSTEMRLSKMLVPRLSLEVVLR
jgi:hypothetical protein